MRTLAWILALAALAVAVSLAAAGNGGYVLLVVPPWRIELSLNLLVVLLLLGFGVGHGLLRLLALARALPAQVQRYRAGRARQEGEQALHQALRLFYEGRYGHALKQAAVAADNDHAPALAALVAARSAHAMQERDKEVEWLQRAATAAGSNEDAESADTLAVLMTTAELAVDSRRYADALSALQRVHQLRGRHIAALRLELRARQGLRQWDEVLRLVRQLEKRGALLPELAREQRYRAHRENLRQRQHDATALQAYRAGIPASEIGPRLTVVLADALLAANLPDEAATAIETQLASAFDAELVQRYGQLPQPQTPEGSVDAPRLRQRLAVAERWLNEHSHDPELLVALGRLCVALRLWGKAQSYLDAALSVRDDRTTHLELARLAESLGRQDEAERHYRQSARMS